MEAKLASAVFAALLLISLAGLAWADFQGFETEYGESFRSRMESWEGMAISAILICIFFNALLYMMGKAIESEEMMRYAKSEFLQVSASALMIFFAVELVYTLSAGPGSEGSALDFMGDVLGIGDSSIACGAVSTGKFILWDDHPRFGSGPIGAFKCKVQEKITALESAFDRLYAANFPNERLMTTCFSLFGVPVYCGDWSKALHRKVESAHLIANKIFGLLMPLHAMYALAEYVQKNMLSIFLPLGLLLRILPPTRGVGGLFIAIAIGFFFVWPTFFLLTDPTFIMAEENANPSGERAEGACFTGFTGSAIILHNVLEPSSGDFMAQEIAISNAKKTVFELTVSVLFYPFVSLVITLIFIRAITPVLGGDMGELMRMVARLG